MDDLETRLHDELHSVAVGVQPSVALDERVPTCVQQRARRRSIALAGVGIASVIALVAGMALLDDDEPTALDTAGQPEGAEPLPGEWATTAPAPIEPRIAFASAWTGEEMLVWGGYGTEVYDDGAAYDPSTDTWRMLSDAPIDARRDPVSVWTGDEWWILGGETLDGVPASGAAAYDPATDSWRTLDQLSESLQMWGATGGSTTALWVDGELTLVRLSAGPATDSTTNSFVVEADGDWRALDFVGAESAVDPDDGTSSLLMNGNSVQCIDPCDLGTLCRVPLDGSKAQVVSDTGGPLGPLAWADGWVVGTDQAFNVADGAVQGVPNEIDPSVVRPISMGPSILAASPASGADGPQWWLWYPSAEDSADLPPLPDESPRYSATAVWTGDEVIVWGGHYCGPLSDCTFDGPVTGLRYRPGDVPGAPTTTPDTVTSPSTAPATTGPPTTVGPTTTQPDGVGSNVKLVAAGTSFGMCARYCLQDVTFDAERVTLLSHAWPGAGDPALAEAPDVIATGMLTDDGLSAVDTALARLDVRSLDQRYGCPDCGDGGAAWVRVTDGVTTVESEYDFGGPPPELEAVDEVTSAIIHALSTCTSNAYVEVDAGCTLID